MPAPEDHNSATREPGERRNVLCDLPAEIIDLIVEHALGFPGRSVFVGSEKETTTELLSHSILRTSKQLRHHALVILTERCLWIRFACSNIETWRGFEEMIPETSAIMYVQRPVLETLGLQTFDIILGDWSSRSELDALWESAQTFYIFPFSSQAWFEFVDLLHEMVSDLTASILTIQCESSGPAIRASLDLFILPSLLKSRPLPNLEEFIVQGSGLRHLSEEDTGRLCRQPSTRPGSGLLQGLLDQVQSLQRIDRESDAAFAILHTSNLYVRVHHWLRNVSRRTRSNLQHEDRQVEAMAKANEPYCAINKIQFQVALSLHHLYSVKGKSWLHDNIHLINYASQWVHDVDFRWVGLRSRELAQLEFASALTFLVEGAILDEAKPGQADNPVDVAQRFHTTQRRAQSSLSAYAVSKLWPDMPQRRLLDEMGYDSVSKYTLDPTNFFLQIHNAGGSNYMWSGNPGTVNKLGNEIAFRHLRKYRPRLSDRADDVERYCDLDCRCIVY